MIHSAAEKSSPRRTEKVDQSVPRTFRHLRRNIIDSAIPWTSTDGNKSDVQTRRMCPAFSRLHRKSNQLFPDWPTPERPWPSSGLQREISDGPANTPVCSGAGRIGLECGSFSSCHRQSPVIRASLDWLVNHPVGITVMIETRDRLDDRRQMLAQERKTLRSSDLLDRSLTPIAPLRNLMFIDRNPRPPI